METLFIHDQYLFSTMIDLLLQVVY
jgi:hypothetical protein